MKRFFIFAIALLAIAAGPINTGIGPQDPPGIVGPASSTIGHIATYSTTGGNKVADTNVVQVSAAPLQIDAGTIATALQTPVTNTVLTISNADSTVPRVVIDGYAGLPTFNGRRSQGTRASPSAILNTGVMLAIGGYGYGATGYSSASRARSNYMALENWTDTAQGAGISFFTTPTGGTATAEVGRFAASGALLLGTTTDDGSGNALQAVSMTTQKVITGTNAQSGTTYTLAATDCGKLVTFTNGSAITVTTLNSIVVGCVIRLYQGGAGQITVSNGSGATQNSFYGYTKTAGQYGILGLFVDTNSGGSAAHYVVFGDGA